ncbi:MAG: AhpC/TSA family protein [Prevotella sp.]|nr:AhpC/TSA family protein [Prevotella sp.]
MKTIKSLFFAGVMGCFLTTALSCATNSKGFVINAVIEGLPDSTLVQLVPMTHDKEEAIAEAVAIGGKFQMTGEVTDTMVVGLMVKDSYGTLRFILENVETTINGKVSVKNAWDGTPSYEWDATVEGSPLSKKLKEFQTRRDELDGLYEKMHVENKDAYEKMQSLKGAELEAFKKTEAYDKLMADEKKFFNTVNETLGGMINDNKDTFWGPLLAMQFYNFFNSSNADMFNQFSETAKNSFYGRKIKEEIWPVGQVGEQAKEFRVTGDDGKELTLPQLLEGKKYVLLDFWASWCGPCRKEIPNVKAQYAKYKDMGFSVIGISIDKDEKAWKKAVTEEQLEWPNFCSPAVADLYKVKAVPTVYLLDAQGNIVAQGDECRGDGLAAKLAELFAK